MPRDYLVIRPNIASAGILSLVLPFRILRQLGIGWVDGGRLTLGFSEAGQRRKQVVHVVTRRRWDGLALVATSVSSKSGQ